MKKVLISIHPRWCAEIFNGQKTIEVRKSFPRQLETPFEVLVYCTKGKENEKMCFDRYSPYIGNGKVIGSFVCNGATCCQAYYGEGGEKHLTNTFGIDLKRACLTEDELFNYIIGKHGEIGTGWLWHITAPTLFDKLRELGEFYTICNKYGDDSCGDCPYLAVEQCSFPCDDCVDTWCSVDNIKPITRPPQSWCYVDELQ